MRFAIIGKRGPLVGEIIWENGVLRGHDALVTELRTIAARAEGLPAGPIGGPYTTHAHLTDPLSSRVLIETRLFATVISRHGDVPIAPPTPEGAVA